MQGSVPTPLEQLAFAELPQQPLPAAAESLLLNAWSVPPPSPTTNMDLPSLRRLQAWVNALVALSGAPSVMSTPTAGKPVWFNDQLVRSALIAEWIGVPPLGPVAAIEVTMASRRSSATCNEIVVFGK